MAIELPVVPANHERPREAQPFLQTLARLRDSLMNMDEGDCIREFQLEPSELLLKSTISLCPDCLRHVPAVVFVRDGRVLMRKTCPDHGLSTALVESDQKFYRLSNKDHWGRRFADAGVMDIPAYSAACCGTEGCCDGAQGAESFDTDFTPQMANKSCTVLVEVTNACNLACPVCYSDAKGDRKLPLGDFKRYILRLIEAKGRLDSVQLTGGEAALNPEFWEMLRFLHSQQGVSRIYLPTNGLLFTKPERATQLAEFRDKLMVLLQFDGRAPSTNRALRAADPLRAREQLVSLLSERGVWMQLTMTLTQDVNDREVGWVVDTAMRHNHIKVVALQPATYSGRYELAPDPMNRLTLSDVVKAVAEQARRRTRPEAFVPIPCSHPNCGWITLYLRRFGMTLNVVRRIDLPKAMNEAAYKTVLSTNEFRRIVGGPGSAVSGAFTRAARGLIRARDMFAIAIKPFMDRFTYDQDRVSACCHHLLDTDGRPVSFCEYNARLRAADSWDRFPRIER